MSAARKNPIRVSRENNSPNIRWRYLTERRIQPSWRVNVAAGHPGRLRAGTDRGVRVRWPHAAQAGAASRTTSTKTGKQGGKATTQENQLSNPARHCRL